jgi:Bacterial Ig domain
MLRLFAVALAAALVPAVPAQAKPRDNKRPTVRLTAPTSGTSVDSSVTFAAAAQDNVGVARVTFRVDGAVVGEDATSPYSLSWSAAGAAAGDHVVSARAVDTAGNTSAQPDPSVTIIVPSTSPAPPPPPPSGSGQYCGTRAPGSPLLTDADATAMRLAHPAERIAANQTANATHPTATQLTSFRQQHAGFDGPALYDSAVTGAGSGTTDELISWAACKYGIDEDTMRAVAVQESDWRQAVTGDLCNGSWTSFGITQVKAPNMAAGCSNGWAGVWPMNRDSTPFNLDFYASRMRECYDGKINWWSHPAGDLWGCIGWWFSGSWHSSGGDSYAASVKQHLANRDWEVY